MLPEGWQHLCLGDVFNFKNGLNGEKSLYGAGAKFVNVMDVFRGPRLMHSEIVGEMAVSPRQLTEFAVRQGDVLFNRTSETDDEIALSTVYLDTAPAVFGGFVIRARPSGKALDQDFCIYSFHADSIRREMIRRGQGAIRSNIGQADLATVPILLPPLPEQRKIAEILSTWDAAISAQERLIANARAQKKALMQTLLPIGTHLPKKRLPGISGEWVRRSFGSFAESEKRRIDPKSLTSPTKCVELEHIESETGALLGFCDAREQASLKSVFDPGHILYGKLRPYLRKFHRPDFSGVCSTEIWSIKANEKICLPDFLYYLIQSPTFEEAVDVSSGSKMPRADWGIVKGTTFQLPGIKEQRAICDLLDVAEAELTHSQQLLTAFREEKSALMQQLLTGKRRVKLEEAA